MAESKQIYSTQQASRQAQRQGRLGRGQALVEYALIAGLMVLGIVAIILATGPSLGNVFNNAVVNFLGLTKTPSDPRSQATFFELVTAAASYTPRSVLVQTNTPPGGVEATATLSPTPLTPTATITGTLTATPTQRAEPSATDADLPYPYRNSMSEAAQWHYQFGNVINSSASWIVEYFDAPSPADWFPGLPVATESVYSTDTDPLRRDINRTWPGIPTTGITNPDNWSVRYRTDVLPLEADRYQIRLIANAAARVVINGAVVASIAADTGVVQTVQVEYVNASAQVVPASVEVYDTSGEAQIQVIFNRFANVGTCGWGLIRYDFRSDPSSFADSSNSLAPASYNDASDCYLRLRGAINIPAGANPRLVFWEQVALASGDIAAVGVREYGIPSATWVWENVNFAGRNLNWKRRKFELDNWQGQNWAGKKVEFAFRITADAANTDDGWYLDDFAVEEDIVNTYTIGFFDDMNDPIASQQNWLDECRWGFDAYKRIGGDGLSWADTPAVSATTPLNYKNGDDCALQINGVVDLTAYLTTGPEVLELSFQSTLVLGSGDSAYVEYRPEGGTTWTALRPFGSALDSVPYSNDWRQIVVRLDSLKETRFELRFRLYADNDSVVADGWHIDDIELRERVIETLNPPFYEPFDTADRWLFVGNWGLTNFGEPYRSTPTSLTDSPGGSYNINEETYAELAPSIRLLDTTQPMLTFWARWSADSANFYVDISTDGGASWEATPIWRRLSGGSDFDDIPVQLAWQRIKVDLTPWRTNNIKIRFRMMAPGGSPNDGWYVDDLRIEEADNETYVLTNGPIVEGMDNPTAIENWHNGGEWTLSIENGNQNSVAWSDSPGGVYNKPARSMLEYRPGIDLRGTSRPVLYFWQNFEIDASDVLALDISRDDGYTWQFVWSNDVNANEWVNRGWHRVQIPLTNYIQTAPSDPPLRIRFRRESLNNFPTANGWYIDDVSFFDLAFLRQLGQTFTDEFNDFGNWVVEGNWTTVPNKLGAWQYQPNNVIPRPLQLPGMTNPTSNWIADYWHETPPTASNQSTRVRVWGWPAGTNVTMPDQTSPVVNLNPDIGLDTSIGEINLDYTVDPVNLPFNNGVVEWSEGTTANNEWYLIRLQRRFNVTQAGEVFMRLNFAGGARLFINNVLQTPRTDLGKPFVTQNADPSNPWAVDADERSYYFSYNFALGVDYDVKIEYYHTTNTQSGPARLSFTMAPLSTVAHTSEDGVNYADLHRTSIISDGAFTIPANRVGNVRYDERWSLTNEDYAKVFYSLDDGFNWIEVTSLRRSNNNPSGGSWTPGSYQDWVDTSFLITDTGGGRFTTPQSVMIKFEIDTRTNPAVDDGWWIDNFQFVATQAVVNLAPTNTYANFNTTTNNLGSFSAVTFSPVVVDQPGDTHTFEILSQPDRGFAGVSVGANQLTYLPPAEWTGTTSFQYRATDQGGLARTGTATITVRPYFYRAVNIGPASGSPQAGPVVIDGNSWDGMAGSGSRSNTSESCNMSASFPGATGDLLTMLRCFSTGSTNTSTRASVTSVEDGIYSVYIWTVETTSAQVFDLYIEDYNDRQRVVNNHSSGGAGQYKRHGPFGVEMTDGRVDVLFYSPSSSNLGRVAGIELWRGGDPDVWLSADIAGSRVSGEAGFTSDAGTIVTVSGSGNDIWNNNDEFRYAWRYETGDLDLIARVQYSALSSNQYQKAGLMIRDSDIRQSRNVSVLLMPQDSLSVAVQRRRWDWDNTSETGSVNNVISNSTDPIWMKLEKRGNTFRGYYSSDGSSWTQIGGDITNTDNFGSRFMIGFAVTSHDDGNYSTATFDNIRIVRYP